MIECPWHLLDFLFGDRGPVIEGVGPKTAEKIREAATQAKLEWDAFDAESERLAAEQERRINSLKRQVSKARRYQASWRTAQARTRCVPSCSW